MSDQIFVVGQEFPDAKSLRTAIKEAAISQHFELRTIKSDLIRYSAQCADNTCPWKIRAAKLSDSQSFTIRSFHGTHTCSQSAREGHSQASVDWLVSLIGERLRDDINYKPREILRDVRKKYGITIPYKKAWRAKERGLEAIYGSSEKGYFLLPSYCDWLKRANPGSFAEVCTSNCDGGETRFRSLFVAFHSSVYGFLNGCLPVIGLGSIRLKSKYLGTLLSASSFDGDGGFFPVAFGVVNADESNESWSWFLTEMRKAFEEVNSENLPRISFLSNCKNGIDSTVKSEFPNSFSFYCLRYLSESIGREFKNNRLVRLLLKAANSTTAVDFRESMSQIEETSSEAATWLSRFDPSRWSLAFSHGSTRFGQLSSNANELEKWLAEARDLPIVQVIETISSRLVSEFRDRRSRSDLWAEEKLCPQAESRVRESVALGSGYQVFRSDESEFEVVVDSDRSHVVNLGDQSCSCRAWQFRGIPCSHAAAVLYSGQRDMYEFVEKYFRVESYRLAYSGEINPSRMGNGSIDMGQEDGRVVRPPKVRRPAGRPEKKRVCLEDPNREKHTVHCSRCNRTGHYKTTCKTEACDLSIK